MKQDIRFHAHALALGCAMAGLFSTTQAATPIAQANLSISDLRYALYDLNANDGITPTVSSTGAWVLNVQTLSNERPDLVSQILPISAGSLLAPQEAQYQSANKAAQASVSGNGLSFSSVLTSDQLVLTSSSREPVTYPSGYESTSASPGYVFTTTTTEVRTDVSATAGNSVGLVMAPPDGSYDGTQYFVPTTLRLSPHTMIQISGMASASVAVDQNAAAEQMSSLPPLANSYSWKDGVGHHEAIDYLYLSTDASATFRLVLSTPGIESTDLEVQNSFSSLASLDLYVNRSGENGGYYFEGGNFTPQSGADSLTKPWSVDIANTSDQDMDLVLSVLAGVGANHRFSAMAVSADVVANELPPIEPPVVEPPIIDPPVIDPGTPSIPEPGTWALMGLGLAGMALVRRRT